MLIERVTLLCSYSPAAGIVPALSTRVISTAI